MIVKIQNRRGGYTDYDPSKLLPGEFAVVQMGDPNTPTGKGVYLAITAGDVVRLATTEEIAAYTQQFDDIYQSTVHDAQQILDTAKSLVSNYSGGLIVVSSTSSMTDTSSLYLYTGSGQYHNYVYAYDSSQSQFVPFFDYGIITEVDGVVAKSAYTTVLSATTYNDRATALAALDSYATNLGGSVRIVGYISTANSVLLGLPKNTSHFMDFYVNSANYRLLVAREVNGSSIYQLAKQDGTWGTTWTNFLSYNIEKYVTIPSGANLNTYTNYGQYRSNSSSVTNSLSNCPVTGFGFILNVYPVGTLGFSCQEIYVPTSATASGTIVSYRRFVNTRDNLFGSWESEQATLNTLTSNITTNTTNIATNTTNIARNASNIAGLTGSLTDKLVKTTLSTTTTYANATTETYNYLSVPGISDYEIVLVRADCANLREWLTFVNGDATPLYMREYGESNNNTNSIRGGYYIDWTNERIGVRYLSATGAYTNQNVYFSSVVGFMKNTTLDGSGSGDSTNPYDALFDAIIAYIDEHYPTPSGDSSDNIPQTTKEAIYTLFDKAAYTETGLTNEISIVEDWATAPATRTVTNNLTACTTSNQAITVDTGSQYTTTLTANTGYVLNTVAVTMGGVDITSTVYTNRTITIPSVTGNIVITATAVLAVSSISAVYTQSGTVYENTSLDTLKSDLVVTATYNNSSTVTVPSTDYTLSGTLTEGTSTVTVTYGGKTTTFSVTVSGPVYLFNLGNECATLTGGWTDQLGFRQGVGNYTAENNGEYLHLERINFASSSATAASISTISAVDLTSFTKMYIDYSSYFTTGSGSGWIYLPTTIANATNQTSAYGSDYSSRRQAIASVSARSIKSRDILEVDLTDYTGNTYLSLNLNLWGSAPAGTFIKVYRIWLA